MKRIAIGVFLALIGFSTGVWAGDKPSPERCEELGMIDVECIICNTGQYLGKISIQAEYDPRYEDCMKRYVEARDKCASFYGTPKDETGIKWSYWIGGTRYFGHYPTNCKQ